MLILKQPPGQGGQCPRDDRTPRCHGFGRKHNCRTPHEQCRVVVCVAFLGCEDNKREKTPLVVFSLFRALMNDKVLKGLCKQRRRGICLKFSLRYPEIPVRQVAAGHCPPLKKLNQNLFKKFVRIGLGC